MIVLRKHTHVSSIGKFPQSFGTRIDPIQHTFGNFESRPSSSSTDVPTFQDTKVEYRGHEMKSREECACYFTLVEFEDGTAELYPIESWRQYSSSAKQLRPHIAKMVNNDNAEEVIISRRTGILEEEKKARNRQIHPEVLDGSARAREEVLRTELLGEDMGFLREEKRRKKDIQRGHGSEDFDPKEAADGATGMLKLNHLDDADWNQEFSDDEGFLDKAGQNGEDLLEEREINAEGRGEMPIDMVESDDEREREKLLDIHGQEIRALLSKPVRNMKQAALDTELNEQLNEIREDRKRKATNQNTTPDITDEADMIKDLSERTLALLGQQGVATPLRDILAHFGLKPATADATENSQEVALRQWLLKTLKSLKKQKKLIFEEKQDKGGTMIRLRS